MNNIIIIIMVVISIWTLKLYYSSFFKRKIDNKIYYTVWIIYIIWQFISIDGLFMMQAHVRLVMSLLITVLVGAGYSCGMIKSIIFAFIYNSIWMLMEALVGTAFIIIDFHYVSEGYIGSVLSKILIFGLVKALQNFFCNENIQKLPYKYDITLLLIPVGSMYIVYNSFMMSIKLYKGDHIVSSFISLIIMLSLNILIFGIYLKVSEYLELRNVNAIYKQEIELYSKHIEEKTRAMTEWRRIKHDLKNQLIYLLELLENGKNEKLKLILQNMIKKEPFEQLIIVNTGNMVIDVLINYKLGIAKKYNISYDARVNVPSEMSFDDADLCIIIGNALDNAIEANLRADLENPYIKFYMKLDSNNLIIVVENSFSGLIKRSKRGKMITVKEDVENHGVGMNSIQRTVEKYNGFLKEYVDEKTFILKLVLYTEEKILHD